MIKMQMPVDDKKIILEAYLKKTITRDEMKFLFEVGLAIPPIPWVFESEAEELKHQRKRELVEKVTGVKFPKITWVK